MHFIVRQYDKQDFRETQRKKFSGRKNSQKTLDVKNAKRSVGDVAFTPTALHIKAQGRKLQRAHAG